MLTYRMCCCNQVSLMDLMYTNIRTNSYHLVKCKCALEIKQSSIDDTLSWELRHLFKLCPVHTLRTASLTSQRQNNWKEIECFCLIYKLVKCYTSHTIHAKPSHIIIITIDGFPEKIIYERKPLQNDIHTYLPGYL